MRTSIPSRRISRRHFIGAMSAAAVAGCAGMSPQATPDFRYRLGLSQPLDSPNYIRLKEMADRVHADTRGRIADTSGFRKHLGAFYARWKGIYGDKAWALLEARVGKLA
jgi:hypothetical protein